MSELSLGDVYVWRNFPKVEPHKSRWLVYIGTVKDGIDILYPCIHVPLLSTTTKDFHYDEINGNRRNDNIVYFSRGEFGFEADCILDVSRFSWIDPLQNFERALTDNKIIWKGHINNDKLREIYMCLINVKPFSYNYMEQIRDNFSLVLDNLPELKPPKRKNRR